MNIVDKINFIACSHFKRRLKARSKLKFGCSVCILALIELRQHIFIIERLKFWAQFDFPGIMHCRTPKMATTNSRGSD